MNSLLSIRDVRVSYGDGAPVLKGVSFDVAERETIAVLGTNGAGKSTLLRTISGLLPLQTGSIFLDGVDISKYPAHRRVEMGLVHVPEGRQMIAGMTVQENLQLGGYVRRKLPAEVAKTLDEIFVLFPILKERRHQSAGSLSGGQQQMLALGRGLMAKPRILMCDEPSLGLAPLVVKEIFEVIGRLRDTGVTILLVEQNARKALESANKAIVLKRGEISAAGVSADLRNSDEIFTAYLGAKSAAMRNGNFSH
jgi:branched-chain amino acid transport system ATP-binding protein